MKRTPLHDAARSDNLNAVKRLLAAGVSIDIRDKEGCTPLIIAAGEGHLETVDALLDAGAKLEAKSDTGHTALLFAALNGKTGTVLRLIRRGAKIAARTRHGHSSLILAAHEGHTQTAITLLDHGAELEAMTHKGHTALIQAALGGCIDTVGALIDRGAKIEARTKRGHTALLLAAQEGHTDTAMALLDRGAQIKACTRRGHTALLLAVHEGHIETAMALLARGAATATESITASPLEAQERRKDSVDTFLEHDASVNARNSNGDTALHVASKAGKTELIAALMQTAACPAIDMPDACGQTALHLSVVYNAIDAAELLIQHGASIFWLDNDGKTPLDYAENDERGVLSNMASKYVREKSPRDVDNAENDKRRLPSTMASNEGRDESPRVSTVEVRSEDSDHDQTLQEPANDMRQPLNPFSLFSDEPISPSNSTPAEVADRKSLKFRERSNKLRNRLKSRKQINERAISELEEDPKKKWKGLVRCKSVDKEPLLGSENGGRQRTHALSRSLSLVKTRLASPGLFMSTKRRSKSILDTM